VTTDIIQGSAATRLRCGGTCNSQFVANFLTNSTVKNFWKSVNICQSYRQKYTGPFFDRHSISIYTWCHKLHSRNAHPC